MKTIVSCILFLSTLTSCIGQNINYPDTKKSIKQNNYHGTTITDNYSWLDDATNMEVINWVKAQDSTTLDYTKSFPKYEMLKNKIGKLTQVSGKMDLPIKANGNYFYIKDNQDGKWGFYMKKEDAKPTALKFPFNPRAIYFYVPSPDSKYLALALAGPGGNFDWKTYNVETQELSKETFRGSDMGRTRITWTKNSKGFYYLSSNKIDENGARSEIKVKFHKLNSNYTDDKIVFSPENDGAKLELKVSDDDKYLVITERNGASSFSKVSYVDIKNSKTHLLVNTNEASYIFLGNDGSRFYFETDLGTSKGKIVSVDIKNPKESWKDIIIEKRESIMGYQSAGGSLLPLIAGDKFVIPTQKDLKIKLKVYSLRGQFEKAIELPNGGLYFNMNGFNALSGSRNNREILTRFIGITEPNTIFSVKTNSDKVQVFDRAHVLFEAAEYISEIVFSKSKDGSMIPISLTYKKGIDLDGSNPLMMQVYGAIGFTNYPYFQGDYIAWLDMGGIHAVAHIRGGGALGSKWHHDGIARHKQNGIDDYISAIEWTIKNEYTSPKKVVLNGVSAGTIPIGGVLTQKPELIGAVVAHYGMFDMIGYAEKFKESPSLAYMVPEIGKASNAEDFKVLKQYSPYSKLNTKVNYPPVLALTSNIDSPLNAESYKFIAKLQDNKNNMNPMLLQIAWDSQHSGFGSQTHSPVNTFTDELAFLIKTLNINTEAWLKNQK